MIVAKLLDTDTREVVSDSLIAYNSMETTKRRHFDYLSLLETKKKRFNLETTEAESELLQSLLSDHDQAVQNFKLQTQALLVESPEAHSSLMNYISVLNEVLDQQTEATAEH